MSLSEWLKAEECEQLDSATYIVAHVANVDNAEQIGIAALLANPCALRRQGILATDTAGFYVWYGPPKNDSCSP